MVLQSQLFGPDHTSHQRSKVQPCRRFPVDLAWPLGRLHYITRGAQQTREEGAYSCYKNGNTPGRLQQ